MPYGARPRNSRRRARQAAKPSSVPFTPRNIQLTIFQAKRQNKNVAASLHCTPPLVPTPDFDAYQTDVEECFARAPPSRQGTLPHSLHERAGAISRGFLVPPMVFSIRPVYPYSRPGTGPGYFRGCAAFFRHASHGLCKCFFRIGTTIENPLGPEF